MPSLLVDTFPKMQRRRVPTAPPADANESLESDFTKTTALAVPVRKPCCTQLIDTVYGSEDDCNVSRTYGGYPREDDGFEQPECTVSCCGRTRSCVLILNNAAAMLHGVVFFVLLSIVLTDEVELSRPLTQQITVWQNTTGTNGSGDACKHSPQCAMPSPKIEVTTSNDGTFDIYTTEIEYGSLDMVWLVLSFSLLSFVFQMFRPFVNSLERNLRPCIARLFCGCCQYDRVMAPGGDEEIVSTYVRDIQAGVNSTRFVEYSFSATVMILAISFTLNIRSWETVLSVAILTFCCQMCGLVAELLLEKNMITGKYRRENFAPAFLLHFVGWVQMVGVFVIIINSFQQSASQAEKEGGVGPPRFVFAIVYSMLGLFSSFAVVQAVDFLHRLCYQQEAGEGMDPPWKCCRNRWWCSHRRCFGLPARECAESSYIVLSLTAKILLSAIIAANLWLSPES